jgi:hypothetical protein
MRYGKRSKLAIKNEERMKYTIVDRDTHERFDTDSPQVAYETAWKIQFEGHDYLIKDNERDEYVSRLSVYLKY